MLSLAQELIFRWVNYFNNHCNYNYNYLGVVIPQLLCALRARCARVARAARATRARPARAARATLRFKLRY